MNGNLLMRLTVTIVALSAVGCGTSINSLRNASRVVSGAAGAPPSLTSFTLTDASPTNHPSLSVSWGVPVGGVTEYCLLENSTDATTCIWHTGGLPTSYTDSSADGPFTLTAFLKNAYGTSSAILSNTVTIDRTAPTLASVNVGNSDPTNDPVFSLSYGAIGFAPYASYCIQENNTSSAACTWTNGALPATYTVAAVNGTKAISVWVRDDAGNVSGRVTTPVITFDGSIPAVAFTSPAAGSYANIATESAFAISGTCSENGRDVVISGAASATVACASGTWSATVDVSAVGAGPFTLKADHSNAASTAAPQASRSFNEDSTAPTVAITSPAAASAVNAANAAAFAISGTCSENGRTVTISGAGNATATCSGAGTWSTTVDVSGAADGAITLKADLSDVAGNPAAQDTRSFTKDAGAPTIAITSPAAGSYVTAANVTAFAVGGTCSEDGRTIAISGAVSTTTVCTTGTWSVNLDFTAVAEGAVAVNADLSDAAGNAATQATRSFTKDTVAPTLASMTITNASPTNSTTYDLTYGAQTGAFTDYCILENSTAVGGCGWTASTTLPTSFTVGTTENAKALTIWLRDAAGNVSTSVTSTNTVTLLTTAPTLASLTVTNASPTNSTTYGLTFGATTGSPTKYCLLENDTTVGDCAWTAYPLPASFTVGTTENAKKISAWLKDDAGNVSTRVDSNSVTYDVTPPTLAAVTILNATPTPSRGYLLDFGSGASEAIGAYCVLQNDTDVAHCSWTTSTALPENFTVSATAGANTLTVWVKDAAGNAQATGTNSNAVTYSNVLAISPATTTISAGFSTYSIEGKRAGQVAVMLGNGKILFAGGCNVIDSPHVYFDVAKLYDPVADKWSSAGSLSLPRCFSAWTTLADGRVFVAGGVTGDNLSTETAEIYDPTTNTWSTTYPMVTSRAYAVATRLANGKVLVSGGVKNSISSTNAQSSTEIYDPATQVWVPGPTMNSKRFQHAAVLQGNGEVLLIGGRISGTNTTATTDVLTMNANGNTATIAAGPALTQKRGSFGAVLLSAAESPTGAEAIAVLAGYDGNTTYLTSVELYDGTSWTTKTAITGARRGASYLKFPNGTIFVTGGTTGTVPIGTTGIYDPLGGSGAGTYTAKATSGVSGSYGICQFDTVPILLANGKPLLIFGISTTGGGHPNLYDPVANSWNNGGTARESYPSYGQVQGPFLQLSSGKVLTCGWRSNVTAESHYCHIVDPQKGAMLPTADQVEGTLREFAPTVELPNGKVLTLGGLSNGMSHASNTSEIYDPATDAWTASGALPGYGYAQKPMLVSATRVIAAGGFYGTNFNNAAVTNKTLVYDIAAGTWTAPASANYPTAIRRQVVLKTPSGRIFSVGGTDETSAFAALYEWNDATTSWTTRASMGTARVGAAAAYVPGGVAGKIFVVGGTTTYGGSATGSSEIYDIDSDTWSAGPSLPNSTTQNDLCAQYVPGVNQVWFVGNWSGSQAFGSLMKYDVAGNTITAGANFQVSGPGDSSAQLGASCGVLNDGRFWNAGGEYSILHVVNFTSSTIRYTASQGDGNYTFSLASGTGTLTDNHVFIPAAPLVSGTSTIQVDDGGGQTASATATVP